jgi:lon-related putative ATP-dependent protease
MPVNPLTVKQLSVTIAPDELPFESLADLTASDEFLGQQRAKKALVFGLHSKRTGYNLFVMGNSGSGRISMVMRHLQTKALLQNTPADWIYVNNFEDVREPWAIEMPTGQGKKLLDDCHNMVSHLLVTIPAAFENPDYQRKRTAIDKFFKHKIDSAVNLLEKEANQQSIALYREANNISFSPIIDGQAVDDIKFASLSQHKRDEINQTIDELEEKLSEALLATPQWSRESYDALQQLDSTTINNAIAPLVDELENKYQGLIGAQIYFKAIRKNLVKSILEHFNLSVSSELKNDQELREILQQTFVPNLLVTNSASPGAPVVYEAHPTYSNLFGRVEYRSEGGVVSTSFQHIRSGALHRANGGYLVVELQKLFEEPYVWGQLKQALQTQELKFEPPMVEGQAMVTIGLNPHAVPLNLKVILVGSRESYYWLKQQDPEFNELFRVLVDFDEQLDRSDETITHMAQLVKSISQSENFAPITRKGFVELVNFSARLCGHQQKLSARFGELFELLGEADIIRELQADQKIDGGHIIEAQNQREYRHSRIRNKMLEQVLQGQIIINTDGSMIGSVNGLTIWQIGSTEFGTPARITATVFPGKKGIVDIERESELGLSLHSKGVLILSGYLANQYARDFPFTLSANIVMEQSYGLVDGDSASLAEVCALISAITEKPIKESFAVTGSINQFGDVQAIGGVNEKIEGFFKLCQARGLTGQQGVIIPKANISNLMLKKEVIDSVEQKLFNIYPVENVEQTIELLCLPAGETMPEFQHRLTQKLKQLYYCCANNHHDNDEDNIQEQ